jgi:hypothetical protein
MVMAGMTKEKIIGSREKKFLKLAWPKRKKVAKKNQPVTSKNIAITMYAIGETK